MREQEDIFEHLCGLLTTRKRVVVLVRDASAVAQMAKTFRDEVMTSIGYKSSFSKFVDFVRVPNGAWVLFTDGAKLETSDEVGFPDLMLWPTEDGDYADVSHSDWKWLRAQQDSPWRPMGAPLPTATTAEPCSVWDRLTSEDDIG